MQPVLIDRRQLAAKTLVEILDVRRIGSHAAHSFLLCGIESTSKRIAY
jgi:hypothetical protein